MSPSGDCENSLYCTSVVRSRLLYYRRYFPTRARPSVTTTIIPDPFLSTIVEHEICIRYQVTHTS